MLKAWFSYVGKIPDDQGFYFLPTVPDLADISDNRPDSPDIEFEGKWKMRQKLKFVHKCMIGRLESILKFWGLRRSEIHRRRPRQYKFEFSFVGNDTNHRRNLGRVGKQQNPRSSGIFPPNENQA